MIDNLLKEVALKEVAYQNSKGSSTKTLAW